MSQWLTRVRQRHLLFGLAGALSMAYLLLTSFRQGWSRVETDFPNYYTAAVLTLQHEPLENFYDWTWFQRHMNYTGTERQLGGYIPHTPLTMAPLLPLARMAPQQAKQVWLILGLLSLAASIAMLAKISGLHFTEVLLLALVAYSPLSINFVLGQYYLLILVLLVAAVWCLLRGKPLAGGALLGLIFCLKLYSAPFLLYFAVRKQWRALAGMAVAIVVLAGGAVELHGVHGVAYYATHILPRALDGEINDPYNAGFGTVSAFLRHALMFEPELNPQPLTVAPAWCFFLRTVYTLGVLGFSLLAISRMRDEGRALGWFVIVLFALSPNSVTYHFILLLVPVVLLLPGTGRLWGAGLIALYGLLALPLEPWDYRLFPRAWLVAALLLYTGWQAYGAIPRRWAAAAVGVLIAIAGADAWRRTALYRSETLRTAQLAVRDPDGIFSSAPVAGGGQIVYQAISRALYPIRVAVGGKIRTLAFEGHSMHPAIAPAGGAIYFELIAGGHSRICGARPDGTMQVLVPPEWNAIEPAVSPDGSSLAFVSGGDLYVRHGSAIERLWGSHTVSSPAFFPDGRSIGFADGAPGLRQIRAMPVAGGDARVLVSGGDAFAPALTADGRLLAYVEDHRGARQVWVEDLGSGERRQVTRGACNNDSPAWLDGRTIIFASDCDRGLGLPALYQAPVAGDP